MILPRYRRRHPRILTYKARHRWEQTYAPETLFGGFSYVMTCNRCGQRPRTGDPDGFRVTHAYG
jgi:hypothetical protein